MKNIIIIAEELNYMFKRLYKNHEDYTKGMLSFIKALCISLREDKENNVKMDENYIKKKICL